MRIIQITDMHIAGEGEHPFDIDVRAQFRRVMKAALAYHPGHIVFTGDLCYREPIRDTYRWLQDEYSTLPAPYSNIPGNHDLSSSIGTFFEPDHYQEDSDEVYFEREIGGERMLFLDSGKGRLSKKQREWMRDRLARQVEVRMIFMHHPPLANAGVPHMDKKYSIKDAEVFQGMLAEFPRHFHVFCGHYHVEKTIHKGNISVHITPSTFFQIDQEQEDFAIEHSIPAFRIIDIDRDRIMSTVRYIR